MNSIELFCSHICNFKKGNKKQKGKDFLLIPFFVSQNLEAELSKKCDELRQLFLLQQQSNNNNNHGGGNGSGEDEATSPTSSSPPTSSTTAFLRSLRKLPSSTSNGGITKPEDEDSNSSSLIANNSGEASEESSINLCFSKEIESLKQNLKTQVSQTMQSLNSPVLRALF